ncbi:MAG: lipid A deacylase LpxR family protein [Opitutales bacterium]
MRPSILTLASAIGISLTMLPATFAEEDRDYGSLAFYLDNDLFVGSDSDYTNGARISYISRDIDPAELPAVQAQLRRISGDPQSWSFVQNMVGFQEPETIRYQWGIALTQLMFTPEDLNAPSAPEGERPYAGWLGLGFSLHVKDPHAINSVELTLGLVGPQAFAKEAQDFVHDVRGFARFEGWDSQIPNEPTLNLHLSQKRRIRFLEHLSLPLSSDGFLELGSDLGTFRTSAYLGTMSRFGYNLPVDFSDPRISLTANTQKIGINDNENTGRFSVYGIIGGRATAVAHDITLDGPLFRDFDTGVSSRPWVAEAYLGFGARWSNWEMSFVHTYRTREFESQADAQSFGSVVIRAVF